MLVYCLALELRFDALVVVELDVLFDRLLEFVGSFELLTVEHLDLHPAEKPLTRCIIRGVALL